MAIRFFTFFILIVSTSVGWSQNVRLQSGEIIEGKIVLPDKIEVETEQGKKSIATKDIRAIEMVPIQKFFPTEGGSDKLTPEEIKSVLQEFEELGPFETPKQTFLTWKEYAKQGSTKGMVSCYAAYRQPIVRKDLRKIKKKDRVEMQSAMNTVDFVIGEAVMQGNQAFMEVIWNKGLHSEAQVLKFTLEGKDWKIIE